MQPNLSLRLLLPAAAAAAAAALITVLPSVDAAAHPLEGFVGSEGFPPPGDDQQLVEEESSAGTHEMPPSPGDVLPRAEASLPLLLRHEGGGESEVAVEEEGMIGGIIPPPPAAEEPPVGKKILATADQVVSRMYELARAQTSNKPHGTRTALLGVAGFLVFFAIHALAQFANRSSIGEDVLFKGETGRTTFSGAGMIVSATLLIAGAIEALIAYNAPKKTASMPVMFPSRGRKQASIGRAMILITAIAITLGFVLGFPKFLMEIATMGFIAGSTLVALGFTLLLREFNQGVDLIRRLYAPHASELKALNEDARIDASLLIQLADHFITKGMPDPVPLDQLGPLEGEEGQQRQPADSVGAGTGAQTPEELVNALAKQLRLDGDGTQDPEEVFAKALGAAVTEFEKNPQLLREMGDLQQELMNAYMHGGPTGVDTVDAVAAAGAGSTLPADEETDESLQDN